LSRSASTTTPPRTPFCCYNIAQIPQTEEFNWIRNSSVADTRDIYLY
jgi:hypothetical protein